MLTYGQGAALWRNAQGGPLPRIGLDRLCAGFAQEDVEHPCLPFNPGYALLQIQVCERHADQRVDACGSLPSADGCAMWWKISGHCSEQGTANFALAAQSSTQTG